MKTFLILVVLFLSSSVVAEDISDFQIEGISIGDSALDFFSEKQIKENEWDYYDDKTYTPVQIDGLSFFTTYDAVDFGYKTGDTKYIIHDLSGINIYKYNIEDCYKTMDEIYKELSQLFKNAEKLEKAVTPAPFDSKTLKTDYTFVLDSGFIEVACYDISKEDGGVDYLSVAIKTQEFSDWLSFKAYK